MKIGLLVDSSAYLEQEYIQQHHIKVASLKVVIDGVSYDETNLDSNDFVFESIDQGKKVTSSQPSPQDFLHLYEEFKNEGYTDVIAIHVSSGISGTIQSSKIASEMVEGMSVHLFDSQSGSMEISIYVEKTIQMIREGKTSDDILNVLTQYRNHAKLRITIDDLNVLVRGGRLSSFQARIGNFINLKPILSMDDEGKIFVLDKVRTKKRVVEQILEEIRFDHLNHKRLIVRITHVNSLDLALELRDLISAISNTIDVEVVKEIGPAFAVHFGKGGFGIAWSKEMN